MPHSPTLNGISILTLERLLFKEIQNECDAEKIIEEKADAYRHMARLRL
jgi:hypothetical protein